MTRSFGFGLRRAREKIDGELIVHCQVGQRGLTATRIFTQFGRRVRNFDGGNQTWKAGVRADCRAPPPESRPTTSPKPAS
ncbi:rhodanese-like domain-containing protein [Diaminobutyricibacter sp. McL0608]|uniref:rhodanese-like domain-containing protein n=1 Tax=Leifsonia sp. McL0608 TaxID=3143537 RepID=UPI0031F2F601